MVQMAIPNIGSVNGSARNRRQAIIWTNAHPNHWRIYMALGDNELSPVDKTTERHAYFVRYAAYHIEAYWSHTNCFACYNKMVISLKHAPCYIRWIKRNTILPFQELSDSSSNYQW